MKIAKALSTRETFGNVPILLIMSTAYIAVGANVQGFKAMLPLVREEFAISSTQAGLYSTFFFLSATLIAIFSGRLVDRLGSKKGLVGGAMMIGILMLLHSIAPVFGVIMILAFFTGIGFSIITPSINKGITEIVPPRDRAVSLGITQAGGGIGGILGATLLPFLGENFIGWRNSVLISAVIALTMGFILLKFYQPRHNLNYHNEQNDHPATAKNDMAPVAEGDNDKKSYSQESSFKEDLRKLIKNKVLITVSTMGFLSGFTISTLTTHYTLYLHDLGYTATIYGLALGTIQMGGIVGKPGWSFVNDRFLNRNRRLGLYILGLMVTIMTFLTGTLLPYVDSVAMILLFSFIIGISSLGIPGLLFTTVGDIVKDELMGTATGLVLIFIRSGVVTGPPLIGLIADFQGQYQPSWIFMSAVTFILASSFFIISRKYQPYLYGSE